MVKVSIIVPVYNAEDVLPRCIDSIINQEYKDFELLLINDGSKDESGNICDAYARKDPRIRVFHKENTGVSDTRNLGIDEAQGEYIQFLDADDWITPDSTKELVRAMEAYQPQLVIADFYRVVGNNIARKGSILSSEVLTQKEFAECMMESPADYYYGVIWNKLYRRDILDKFHLRMDKSLSFCEDFVFNLEYYLHCDTIYPLQVPVYYYYKTDGSLVAQNLRLDKLVAMKTSIYQYYDNFFKHILDEERYEQERLSIARFLVSAATDDMAIPLFPGTRKLGEESVQAYFSEEGEINPISQAYYLNKIFDRYLNTIAMKYDLELRDVRVFYALREAGGTKDARDIADYTGIPQAMVFLSLQKLAMRGLAKVRFDLSKAELEITDDSKALCDELDVAVHDLENACTKGFSEEEIKLMKQFEARVSKNLKDDIQTI